MALEIGEGGGHSVPGNLGGRGSKKTLPSVGGGGGVDFSGITRCMKKRQSLFSSRLVWLSLIRASYIPASRIDISRTEQQQNKRKKS